MAGIVNPGRQRSAFARGIAWLILIVWAGVWILFNVASGIGEIAELGPMAFVMHLIMPVVILVLLWICWRWELAGGILLLAATAYAYFLFGLHEPDRNVIQWQLMLITLILPAVFSGVLLILCGIASWAGRPKSEPPARP